MARPLGRDLDDVRIHTGGADSAAAVARGAAAYTVGTDIFFAPGRYAPNTQPGRALIAHELAHVVQQTGSTPPAGHTVAKATVTATAAEHQADAVAHAVTTGTACPTLSPVATQAPQCAPLFDTSWLDSWSLNQAAPAFMGSMSWTFLRELLRGALNHLAAQPPERITHIAQRYVNLNAWGHWQDKEDYAKGLIIGIAEGLWEQLKGLWEALVALVKLSGAFWPWVGATVPHLVVKYGPKLLKALEDTGGINLKIGQMIWQVLSHPWDSYQQAKALLEGAVEAGLGKARDLGKDAADAFLRFAELPYRDWGESAGKVTGMALFEVIMAVATEGIVSAIGTAGRLAARLVARGVEEAVTLFREARQLVGTAVGWVMKLLERLKGSLKEMFSGLAKSLKWIEEVIADLIPGLETEFATAGGPGGIGRISGSTAGITDEAVAKARTVKTTVEDLKGGTKLESRALKDTGGGAAKGGAQPGKVAEPAPAPKPKPEPAPKPHEVPPPKPIKVSDLPTFPNRQAFMDRMEDTLASRRKLGNTHPLDSLLDKKGQWHTVEFTSKSGRQMRGRYAVYTEFQQNPVMHAGHPIPAKLLKDTGTKSAERFMLEEAGTNVETGRTIEGRFGQYSLKGGYLIDGVAVEESTAKMLEAEGSLKGGPLSQWPRIEL
jgi:hypothetical protein